LIHVGLRTDQSQLATAVPCCLRCCPAVRLPSYLEQLNGSLRLYSLSYNSDTKSLIES
jgi:hypothetical protein